MAAVCVQSSSMLDRLENLGLAMGRRDDALELESVVARFFLLQISWHRKDPRPIDLAQYEPLTFSPIDLIWV